MIQRNSDRIALGICLYFLVLAIFYAAATPAFEAPDEGAHFLYIDNLLKQGHLPLLEGREVVFASRSTQRHQPPLYYLIGAVLVAGTQRNDVAAYFQSNPFAAIGTVSPNNQNVVLHPQDYSGDTGTAIWILRVYSIALATLTLWFVYCAGRLAFQRESTGLLAMLLVASIPGFIFIGASINNDNLVTVAYAAGVYWSLRVWQRHAVANNDILALSLILSVAALSKLTGLTLFGVVYLAAIAGALQRRFPWHRAILLIVISLEMSAVLAGWWYIRNLALYGDPLAMQATLVIWSRGGMPVTGDEIKGIWESIWMILGNFNIRGPEWLYVYVIVITLAGVAGLIIVWQRFSTRRWQIAFLVLVCLLLVVTLGITTRQINISQGRILYPALVAFAPLMAAGWQTLLGRKVGSLLIVPLAIAALVAPAIYLPRAYTPLDVVSTLPPETRPLNITAETLTIKGYQLITDVMSPGDPLRLKFCFSGQHAENPNLFVKAINPITQVPVGSVDTYPGMSPTNDRMSKDAIYCAPVALRLSPAAQPMPVQLKLQFGWNVPGHFVPLKDANGQPLGSLIVDGPTLIDPHAHAEPATAQKVTYGDGIELVGYTPNNPSAAIDSHFKITFYWRNTGRMITNYVTAVVLLDASGKVIAQADGEVAGYPTSAWRPGPDFADTRELYIPANLPPAVYRLYVGWYDPSNGVRLPAKGALVGPEPNLAEIPISIQ